MISLQNFSHSSAVQGFIKKFEVKRFAEVGVYKCRFLKTVVRNSGYLLNEYWAVDPWKLLPDRKFGRMSKLTQEDWNAMYLAACKLMRYFPCLKVVRLSSDEAAGMFPDGYFDMVYIDATHFYEDTLLDLRSWEPKIRKPGGIISGHDYITPNRHHQGVKKAVDEVYGEEKVITGVDGVWLVKL